MTDLLLVAVVAVLAIAAVLIGALIRAADTYHSPEDR